MEELKTIITNPISQIEKHDTRSERYGFVSTEEILSLLGDQGWNLTNQSFANTKNPEKKGFQKHLLRFQNDNFQEIGNISESNKSIPELVLLNSHDGTSSFRLFFGLLRMACLNGIISGDNATQIKVNHSINAIKDIQQNVELFTDTIPQHIELIQNLANTQVTLEQEAQLTKRLFDARLEKTRNVIEVGYNTTAIRDADTATDAFTVMNKIQEKLIRGGIQYIIKKDDDFAKLRKTRAISGIDQNLKMNQLVFNEFSKLAA